MDFGKGWISSLQEKSPGELNVIVRAKELARQVIEVTQKSPKQFRYTFVSKLQNLSLDVIESLYRANDTFVAEEPDMREKLRIRLDYQHKALTDLRILAYMADLARENKVILPRQHEQISRMSADCMKMLGGWMNSDKKRFGSR